MFKIRISYSFIHGDNIIIFYISGFSIIKQNIPEKGRCISSGLFPVEGLEMK